MRFRLGARRLVLTLTPVNKNLITTRNETRQAYEEYIEANGLELATKSELTKAIQQLAPKVKDGSTRINGKKERAWIGFGLRDLEQMEQLEQQNIPAENGQQSILLENENGVPSVPSVPLLKNCGQCANFRMPNCEAESWETRNGNAAPFSNWCFKPQTYEEAF